MGTSIVVFAVLAFIGLVVFLRTPPSVLAGWLRGAFPVALMAAGATIMVLFKSFGFGAMVLLAGFSLWRRMRRIGRVGSMSGNGSRRSSVRSAVFEMELDHDSGAMNGVVLVGSYEGAELEQLTLEELYDIRREITGDGDSIGLLDTYLDRRFPHWREDGEADVGTGEAGPTGSGPMSKQEAYEVLGLATGAGTDEIRKAHRRLMKSAHPDSGGSTFLATKINEAKDVLLKGHS